MLSIIDTVHYITCDLPLNMIIFENCTDVILDIHGTVLEISIPTVHFLQYNYPRHSKVVQSNHRELFPLWSRYVVQPVHIYTRTFLSPRDSLPGDDNLGIHYLTRKFEFLYPQILTHDHTLQSRHIALLSCNLEVAIDYAVACQ